ncbi:MAG: MTH1187 family thiamine-binding protein [Candidatus Acididesulfobacter guangdongensis]|uniref:MTH1187 family thiamine-binding protein n=1 Tax=Acididesulfobacter guangdongensis TaxID=2597225 RepID=A0A519BEK7_ACIG2|nr:MAG: MTH1187 family thiamine-binding protein [Candidatus Acididesulfobacter guangdongensis]
MSYILSISMFPVDKGESLSLYVSKVSKIIDNSGLEYVITPMATMIESENIDDLLNIIKMGLETIKDDSNRVYANMAIDYRKSGLGRLKQKVESLKLKIEK